jgi:hypothetical protein
LSISSRGPVPPLAKPFFIAPLIEFWLRTAVQLADKTSLAKQENLEVLHLPRDSQGTEAIRELRKSCDGFRLNAGPGTNKIIETFGWTVYQHA